MLQDLPSRPRSRFMRSYSRSYQVQGELSWTFNPCVYQPRWPTNERPRALKWQRGQPPPHEVHDRRLPHPAGTRSRVRSRIHLGINSYHGSHDPQQAKQSLKAPLVLQNDGTLSAYKDETVELWLQVRALG